MKVLFRFKQLKEKNILRIFVDWEKKSRKASRTVFLILKNTKFNTDVKVIKRMFIKDSFGFDSDTSATTPVNIPVSG